MYSKLHILKHLALYHTLSVSEALYLILSFVLMLILIISSLAEWRHGWCVLCMCENEVVTCTYSVHTCISMLLSLS